MNEKKKQQKREQPVPTEEINASTQKKIYLTIPTVSTESLMITAAIQSK